MKSKKFFERHKALQWSIVATLVVLVLIIATIFLHTSAQVMTSIIQCIAALALLAIIYLQYRWNRKEEEIQQLELYTKSIHAARKTARCHSINF